MQRTRSVVRIAALRAFAHRFSFLLLIMAAIALMVMGRVDTVAVDGVRARVTDAFAPILEAFSAPADTIGEIAEDVQQLVRLSAENEALRAETLALQQFRQAAFRLEAENLSLRTLMNYRPEAAHAFLTARVIGDNSGAFVRSLSVNLGAQNGLNDGQAAMGPSGLIGRVVQTGERSARILLITDLNARIPVVVERTRQRAVLAGDNSAQPQILYLPPDVDIRVGDRIYTSGHGGMFPAGLSVGTVAAMAEGLVRVEAVEDLDRVEFVRITDFRPGTSGGEMLAHPGYDW